MTTTYSTSNDLYLAFGQENIEKWADLNNNKAPTEIADRLDWARAQAYDELNSRLAQSPYQFPLAGTPPIILTRMEAYLAGVLLYESRGVTDVGTDGKAQHTLMWHRKRVDEFVRDIYARRIALQNVTLRTGAVTEVRDTPQMVCFPDPGARRGVKHLGDDLIYTVDPTH